MNQLSADHNSSGESIRKISGMYKTWFLDYASYVILERAIPSIYDGLKPVQRRILHSMKELDDGRYNKVANIVGNTMKYHPHGDAAISDAIVQIGQKDLLIDAQGNWGNIFTGDRAAAARYIEARLTKFGSEVVFNPKTTIWKASYDGRNDEPVDLPVKFPLLLTHGVEGIAVGLSTKVLPHNFNELIEASIAHLQGKEFKIFPDFITGGMIDVSQYNDGQRGGRIRVRAKINRIDKSTLSIVEIPYNTTTSSLIDSILKANDNGKIKIKKIEDNTARVVEIRIHLAAGVSPDKTIDALYAFTDCEISLSPIGCVIENKKPIFLGVSTILRQNTDHTVNLLRRELEIALEEYQEQWHALSLERIFIENRIYRDIEEQETWEGVLLAIDEGLKPHVKHLLRAITQEDLMKLTEIKIKKISKFDIEKAQQQIEAIEGKMLEVKHHLDHLIVYAITYYKNLKVKYGKGRERKTEIRIFDEIQKEKVAIANTRLYVNREEGFIGTALKRDEFVCECSDIDDIIVFRKEGVFMVTKIDNKTFVGKNIIHVAVWKKGDKRIIYNLIYRDGKHGYNYMKRFSVTAITRDRTYDITQENKDSEILYFTGNPNGEAETISVFLKPLQKLRKLKFEVDFSTIGIKSRTSKGNLVSKYPIKKVELKEAGISTLSARKVWFDDSIRRLNTEERGVYLGKFSGEDKIMTLSQNGTARLLTIDLGHHFDDDTVTIEKWIDHKPITCVYYDQEKSCYYIKRFLLENTLNTQIFFPLTDNKSYVELLSTDYRPVLEMIHKKGTEKVAEVVVIDEFIAVKGIKAKGNQLSSKKLTKLMMLDSLPYDQVVENENSTIVNDDYREGEDEDTQITLFE